MGPGTRTHVCRVTRALAPLLALGALPCVAIAAHEPDSSASPSGPRPGEKPAVVTIDPNRMCLLIDGRPFFARGSMGTDHGQMKGAAEAGLNVAVQWDGPGRGGGEFQQAMAHGEQAERAYLWPYLDATQQAGVWGVEMPLIFRTAAGTFDLYCFDPSFPQNLARFLQRPLPHVVEAVRDHPALLGYYGPDEPGANQQALCRDYAAAIRARDPAHPVYVALGGTWYSGRRATTLWGPMRTRCPVRPPLHNLFSLARAGAQAAHAIGRPYWHVPLMEIRNCGEPPPHRGSRPPLHGPGDCRRLPAGRASLVLTCVNQHNTV